MIIRDLVDKFGFKLIVDGGELDRPVSGLKCCDLLSWVMANGEENDAWITVQTHTNILAVASLLDMSCIIVPEDITIDEETVKKAKEQDITLISTELGPYQIFVKFYEAGLR